jgi:hypothetical protein
MRFAAILAVVFAASTLARAQEPKQAQPQPQQPAAAATPQTETVSTPQPAQAAPGTEGYLGRAQVKELLHKVWLAEYRINDLLTEVHPERWKLADTTRSSFEQTLETLRAQVVALDGWRTQLEARPENAYLGYMTCGAMGAVLPRLDGVARSIAQHENPSFGAQFSQAGNQLFDLQQSLGLYLGTLLRSQDEGIRALQNNLAACQNELGYALRRSPATVRPVMNVLTELKRRRASSRASGKTTPAPASKKPVTSGPAKLPPKKP